MVGALLLALILLHGTYDLLETTGTPYSPLLMNDLHMITTLALRNHHANTPQASSRRCSGISCSSG
jgi:hypothetical protein